MLVAFEGIDGSGKSTTIRAVAAGLRRAGRRILLTAEPTKTRLGRAVRQGIRSRLDPLALACLFLADRAQHVADLRRDLRPSIVLTDRYADSTTAYQAVALRSRLRDPLETLRRLQVELFPRPDLVLLFDLEPAAALARIGNRRVREPFERRRFLEEVRRNYAALARREPGRWRRLDATRPPRELAEQATREILARARRPARG